MRTRLLAVARDLFAEKGFAATGAPEIAAAAGVTRGALHHHFGDKAGLFDAVVLTEAKAIADRLADIPAGQNALRDGAIAWFEAMEVPGRARLMVVDGPAVLGPRRMAEIDAENGGGALADGLSGLLVRLDVPGRAALAEMLSAGFDRAALAVAGGKDREPYLAAMIWLLDRLGAAD